MFSLTIKAVVLRGVAASIKGLFGRVVLEFDEEGMSIYPDPDVESRDYAVSLRIGKEGFDSYSFDEPSSSCVIDVEQFYNIVYMNGAKTVVFIRKGINGNTIEFGEVDPSCVSSSFELVYEETDSSVKPVKVAFDEYTKVELDSKNLSQSLKKLSKIGENTVLRISEGGSTIGFVSKNDTSSGTFSFLIKDAEIQSGFWGVFLLKHLNQVMKASVLSANTELRLSMDRDLSVCFPLEGGSLVFTVKALSN